METGRADPDGTTIVPAARPFTTGLLNTSGVGMTGAMTATTTVVTVVVEPSATRTRVASLSGPTPSWLQAGATRRQASAVDSARKRTRDMKIDLCQGSECRGQLLYRIHAIQKRPLQRPGTA